MSVHSTQRKLPDNSHLLILESLWRTESLTLTGSELGTSTATVSRGLSAAREFFDDPLFVRSGARMLPTDLMRRLAPQIADILERAHALTVPDVFDPRNLTRTFRIAAADNGVLAFLFPAINDICRQAPGISFEVLGIHGDLFEDLRYGKIDLAFFPFSPIPDDCRSSVLVSAPDVIMVRKNHPLVELYKQKKVLTLEDIQAYPKVRISNVSHKFPAAVVKHHDCLMAQEAVGAVVTMPYFLAAPWLVLESDATAKILERNGKFLAKYLPIELLPLPGIAQVYDRRIVWHEKSSHDPALQWLIAMLAASSKKGEDNAEGK